MQPYFNCGQCGACRRGHAGFGGRRDGGMREIVNVPLKKLVKTRHPNDELPLIEMLSMACPTNMYRLL
jgi:threonine dehydrogenase-like Zn-dependent dehydrogenase